MRVFIASSGKEGILNIYKELASSVATILARKGFKAIFGGGSKSMMGTTYMTYKYEGGKIKGFYDVSDAKTSEELELDAVDVSPNTFERTHKLYEHADLIIILPGGVGTIAEFFSMIVEKQTRYETKKIILFNYNKYYDNLLFYFKDMLDEHFIDDNTLKQFDIVTNLKDFEKMINDIEIKEED